MVKMNVGKEESRRGWRPVRLGKIVYITLDYMAGCVDDKPFCTRRQGGKKGVSKQLVTNLPPGKVFLRMNQYGTILPENARC
jgi:hypothetical protein